MKISVLNAGLISQTTAGLGHLTVNAYFTHPYRHKDQNTTQQHVHTILIFLIYLFITSVIL